MNNGVEVARGVLGHHSKSFALAARLLPVECRDDAAVVYAWCRRCDDAVDCRRHDESPAAILASLREQLESIYRGERQTDPVLAAFQEVTTRRLIPKAYPLELLAGMGMDTLGTRYEDLDGLLLYCFRVAGTVGLMMCHVMGVQEAKALEHAAHLGMAMQLTNICRDVAEDWKLGRLYIPAALLPKAGDAEWVGYPSTDGAGIDARAQPAIVRAVRSLLALADRLYGSGDRGLRSLSFRCAIAVRAARLVYAAIGTRLARQGYNPLLGRAHTSKATKLLLALRAVGAELLRAPPRGWRRWRRAPLPRAQYPDDILSPACKSKLGITL